MKRIVLVFLITTIVIGLSFAGNVSADDVDVGKPHNISEPNENR